MRHRKISGTTGTDNRGIDSDGDGDHPLAHIAAASGDVALLTKAVQKDPGVIQQRDGEGHTPLAHAVHGKHLHAVKRLVKMGADVNAQDSQGRTYLSIAAYQGWHEGVVYLLRKGARQNIVDKSGRTPLHASTYDTDTRSIIALMKRLRVDDLNAADNEKMTALHWSAFHDRPEHVRLLLMSGADTRKLDVDGKTPLHWAAQNGSRSCCLLLAQCYSGTGLLCCVDSSGKTAMHLAAAAGKAGVIQDLAHYSPDLCVMEDQDDRTPLHWSAAMGHFESLKTLLQLGVSPNPIDVDGISPLEYAKRANHKQCLTLLEGSMSLKSQYNAGSKSPTKSPTKQTESKTSSVGFFKGLFSKKQKQTTNRERDSDNRLPRVVVTGETKTNTKVLSPAPGNQNNLEKDKEGTARLGTLKHFNENSGTPSDKQGVLGYDDGAYADDDMTYLERVSANRKKRKKHRRRSERNDDASPATTNTTSSWNEDIAISDNYTSRALNPRIMHLSPLGNVRPLSISPRVSQNVESPSLTRSDVLPLRRQGELSPLRASPRLPSVPHEVPLPYNLVNLQMSDIKSRSPTPPPFLSLNMNTKKALPDISPLTQSMESLEIETKKRRKKKKKHRTTEFGDTPIGVSSPTLSTPENDYKS